MQKLKSLALTADNIQILIVSAKQTSVKNYDFQATNTKYIPKLCTYKQRQ